MAPRGSFASQAKRGRERQSMRDQWYGGSSTAVEPPPLAAPVRNHHGATRKSSPVNGQGAPPQSPLPETPECLTPRGPPQFPRSPLRLSDTWAYATTAEDLIHDAVARHLPSRRSSPRELPRRPAALLVLPALVLDPLGAVLSAFLQGGSGVAGTTRTTSRDPGSGRQDRSGLPGAWPTRCSGGRAVPAPRVAAHAPAHAQEGAETFDRKNARGHLRGAFRAFPPVGPPAPASANMHPPQCVLHRTSAGGFRVTTCGHTG